MSLPVRKGIDYHVPHAIFSLRLYYASSALSEDSREGITTGGSSSSLCSPTRSWGLKDQEGGYSIQSLSRSHRGCRHQTQSFFSIDEIWIGLAI